MQNIINIRENNKRLTFLWLIQSVGALALSGFFAIFLVAARSPGVTKILPHKNIFHTVLTIHVNLSVLIWLTSIVCTVFATRTKSIKLGYTGFFFCAVGTIIIACGIFDVHATPYLNNYVPILESQLFRYGIWIYFFGLFIASLQVFRFDSELLELKIFNFTSFLIILAALSTLLLTRADLSSPANRNLYNYADFYEKLFWGFGHILQFLYTNIMMMALFWIIKEISAKADSLSIINTKIIAFCLNAIFAVAGIFIILKYDVTTFEYTGLYSRQMIMFNGIGPVLALIAVGPVFLKNYSSFSMYKPQRNSIIWCIILFGAGGINSTFISGTNTIIPAHYHGAIIGISVCLMGLCYQIMPKLGYPPITGRLANIQPTLYGFGQLIHITGFALSGGYGAMRKTPGVELPPEAKVYMGLMGIGGLISIIGGLFFVIIIFKTIIKNPKV